MMVESGPDATVPRYKYFFDDVLRSLITPTPPPPLAFQRDLSAAPAHFLRRISSLAAQQGHILRPNQSDSPRAAIGVGGTVQARCEHRPTLRLPHMRHG